MAEFNCWGVRKLLAMFASSTCIVGCILATVATTDPSQEQRARYERYLDYPSLIRGGTLTPNWMADGDRFWFVDETAEDAAIQVVDPTLNTQEPLEEVSALDSERVQFEIEGQTYVLNVASYSVEKLDSDGASGSGRPNRPPMPERASPDGKFFAFVKEGDVWLRAAEDGATVTLTQGATDTKVWNLHSRRWNAWSPDSRKLVAFQVDNKDVFRAPQVHYLERQETVRLIPFPKTGEPLERSEVFIFDVESKARVRVDLQDTTDQYLVVLGWLPDASEVLLARYSRDFKRVDVLAADAAQGTVRTLLTETADTFVQTMHDVLYFRDCGFTLLPDGKHFIWESTRDGWNHLYLYNIANAKLIRQLTAGDFPVLRVVELDEMEGWVYFTAHAESRLYDTHVYRVRLDGGDSHRLTDGDGQHAVTFSPSKQFFVDTFSSISTPPKSQLRSANGELLRTLAEADISELESVGWMPPEEFVVKAADGETDLYGVMFKPADFDPAKKYPVIDYIYGGPQGVFQYRDFMEYSPFNRLPRALPQLGYIVVMVDGRGTPERSKAFQDVIYGNWGRYVIPDHAAAIRQLGDRYSYVDLDRVGIFGHSWGGYHTTRALAQAPELFKVGVASGPTQTAWTGALHEPYMGLPAAENAEAYDYADNTIGIWPGKITGHLLLSTGTSDQGTLKELYMMVDALSKAGVVHDQLLLPGVGHGYAGHGRGLYEKTTVRYFQEHL